MPIPPQHAAHPTTKLFDDEEWIRSLTEAQEITADVPEGSVTYDLQAVEVRPIQMAEFLRKYVSRRLLALSEGEIAALITATRQLGVERETFRGLVLTTLQKCSAFCRSRTHRHLPASAGWTREPHW